MSTSPSVDDLRLVLAVAEEGSVGAAARRLRISQPSASTRLASIERRCGTRLFDRDTTGARPTPAGAEMAQQARHILGHLDQVYAATVAAAEHRSLRVGTFVSLAPALFPALERELDQVVTATVGHGPALMDHVAEGSLDAAAVAVAEQVALPRGVRTHALGEDSLVLVRKASTPGVGRGRQPLKGRRVVYSTYDLMGPVVRERLERLGAWAHQGVTLPSTLALARHRDCLAVLPRSAVAHQLGADEVIEPLPFRIRIRLSLVTGRDPDARLVAAAPALRRALHLTAAARTR